MFFVIPACHSCCIKSTLIFLPKIIEFVAKYQAMIKLYIFKSKTKVSRKSYSVFEVKFFTMCVLVARLFIPSYLSLDLMEKVGKAQQGSSAQPQLQLVVQGRKEGAFHLSSSRAKLSSFPCFCNSLASL